MNNKIPFYPCSSRTIQELETKLNTTTKVVPLTLVISPKRVF